MGLRCGREARPTSPILAALHTRFGTTSDEDLVDPAFPRRFVPRAFDAIIRNQAHPNPNPNPNPNPYPNPKPKPTPNPNAIIHNQAHELLPTFTARVQARAVSAMIRRGTPRLAWHLGAWWGEWDGWGGGVSGKGSGGGWTSPLRPHDIYPSRRAQ